MPAGRYVTCLPPSGVGAPCRFQSGMGDITYLLARRAETTGAAEKRSYADAEGERPPRRKSHPNAGNAYLPGRPRSGRAHSALHSWNPILKGGSSGRNRPYPIKIWW